jgi:peptidoglycan/LPS O-acetylase OafA/YrhL
MRRLQRWYGRLPNASQQRVRTNLLILTVFFAFSGGCAYIAAVTGRLIEIALFYMFVCVVVGSVSMAIIGFRSKTMPVRNAVLLIAIFVVMMALIVRIFQTHSMEPYFRYFALCVVAMWLLYGPHLKKTVDRVKTRIGSGEIPRL